MIIIDKTFVYNTGNPTPPKNELYLEFGMFFDGILNKKNNSICIRI